MTGGAVDADDRAPEPAEVRADEVWEPPAILRLPDLTIIRVSIPPPWPPWQGNRAERRRKRREE